MSRRDLLFLGVVLGGLGLLSAGLLRSPASRLARRARVPQPDTRADIAPAVRVVNQAFKEVWAEKHLTPTPPAPELELMRRLGLALTGKAPSLEEIRRFESRPLPTRLDAWLEDLLRDRRCGDYLAERLARAFVGTEDGPFILFRRSRFTGWLSDAVLENRPYDVVVRQMIAADGVWTDHPATNFITVTRKEETERPDPERVGARVARAFLGVRLDCAQCHDHPFQPWKQADFRGLAAFFGGLHANLRGVRDETNDYAPPPRRSKDPGKVVEPRVPFHPELLPAAGPPRERLAAWVTDPRNENLARVTVNRIWALLFGRPLSEPVDDLPLSGEVHPALEKLAADFAGHGYDLRRLLCVIVASEPFRLNSAGIDEGGPSAEQDEAWAAFPMTRLRPEQVAGSIFQAASLSTLEADAPWLVRLATFTGQNDFVRRYGDTGEDEFDTRSGTIPQRLLLLNGDIVRNKTKSDFLNAPSRIAALAPTDRKAVEIAFLTVLTRRPSPEESSYFEARVRGTKGEERKERLGDLCWTLMNATEFSWNH
jgi:hypothetical protein